LSLTAIKIGLFRPALAGTCEAPPEVSEVRKTVDALLSALDALLDDLVCQFPVEVIEKIERFLSVRALRIARDEKQRNRLDELLERVMFC
jgi:hypothetical protein